MMRGNGGIEDFAGNLLAADMLRNQIIMAQENAMREPPVAIVVRRTMGGDNLAPETLGQLPASCRVIRRRSACRQEAGKRARGPTSINARAEAPTSSICHIAG